jgi:hypothetical protein
VDDFPVSGAGVAQVRRLFQRRRTRRRRFREWEGLFAFVMKFIEKLL